MSATDVIEEIKALPAEEKARVYAFLQACRSEFEGAKGELDDSARAAGEWVIKNYGDLLRKLAQ